MSEFTIEQGQYFLPDTVDEMTEFPSLEKAKEPLIVNFSRLKTINSYGTRNFIKWIRSWEPKKFEFHECTPVFVDAVNVVLNLVGTKGDTSCIKSFYIPHVIEDCDQCDGATREFLFETSEVDYGNLVIAEKSCPQCNRVMEPDVELDEYLAFFEAMPENSEK